MELLNEAICMYLWVYSCMYDQILLFDQCLWALYPVGDSNGPRS